jgi:hypothetical protein
VQQRNAADLCIAVIAHPLGGISARAAQERITPQVFDTVVGAFTESDAPVTASR